MKKNFDNWGDDLNEIVLNDEQEEEDGAEYYSKSTEEGMDISGELLKYAYEYVFEGNDPLELNESNYRDTMDPLVDPKLELLMQKATLSLKVASVLPPNLQKTWESYHETEKSYLRRVMPMVDEFNCPGETDPKDKRRVMNAWGKSCEYISSRTKNLEYIFIGRPKEEGKQAVDVPKGEIVKEIYIGRLEEKGRKKGGSRLVQFGEFMITRNYKNKSVMFEQAGITRSYRVEVSRFKKTKVIFDDITDLSNESMVLQKDVEHGHTFYTFFEDNGIEHRRLTRNVEINRPHQTKLVAIPNNMLTSAQVTRFTLQCEHNPEDMIESYTSLPEDYDNPLSSEAYIKVSGTPSEVCYTWVKNGKGYMISESKTYKGGFNSEYLFEGQGTYDTSNSSQEGLFKDGQLIEGKKITDVFDYLGSFQNNRFHGFGDYKTKKSFAATEDFVPERYVGEFIDGRYDGKGILYKGEEEEIDQQGIWKDGTLIESKVLSEHEVRKPNTLLGKFKHKLTRNFSYAVQKPAFPINYPMRPLVPISQRTILPGVSPFKNHLLSKRSVHNIFFKTVRRLL